jgi:hypothetical protein
MGNAYGRIKGASPTHIEEIITEITRKSKKNICIPPGTSHLNSDKNVVFGL